jgi:hypothetical protein
MLRIFRKIRRQVLQDTGWKKYLLYATGEILLVMVGILLALQVNNWNENRKNRKIETKLLSELQETLNLNASRLRSDLDMEQQCTHSINILLEHLDNRRPYHDSLDLHFATAHFSPDIVISTSGYESIKDRGMDLIRRDALRRAILRLFDDTNPFLLSETFRLENQFWPTLVLPLENKYFRESKENKRSLVSPIKPVDYSALLNDVSYTNMLADRRSILV